MAAWANGHVNDNIKVMLSFEDGLSVLIEASTNCFIPSPRWHVSGQDGTFVIQDWGCNGKIVQLADKNDGTTTCKHDYGNSIAKH